MKQLGEDKMAEWRRWFDSRLDDAIEAAATQENPQIEGTIVSLIVNETFHFIVIFDLLSVLDRELWAPRMIEHFTEIKLKNNSPINDRFFFLLLQVHSRQCLN